MYRKKPPVPSKLVEMINKEFEIEDSEDESVLDINEEKTPLVMSHTRQAKTFHSIETKHFTFMTHAKSTFN